MNERGLWLAVLNTLIEDAADPNTDKDKLRRELESTHIKHVCKTIDFDYSTLVKKFNQACSNEQV